LRGTLTQNISAFEVFLVFYDMLSSENNNIENKLGEIEEIEARKMFRQYLRVSQENLWEILSIPNVNISRQLYNPIFSFEI